MWLENTNGYLTHYAFAYLAGPAIGGVAAGLFHLVHANAFVPEEKSYLNLRGHSNEKERLVVN